MTIYYIDLDENKIKSETYVVANLMAFYEEMDQVYQDGWYDTYEDAEAELIVINSEG